MALPTIFDKIIKSLRLVIRSFPDGRTGKSLTCNIEDIVLGAFSVFLIQSPSFLTYQRTMVTTQVPKTTIQGTSLCRNYLGRGGYCNQTGNLTAEYAEGRGGEING